MQYVLIECYMLHPDINHHTHGIKGVTANSKSYSRAIYSRSSESIVSRAIEAIRQRNSTLLEDNLILLAYSTYTTIYYKLQSNL